MSTAARILAGDVPAAAALMRDLDDERPGALDTLREIYPRTGNAFVLGITGNPGAGKSTLADVLITQLRASGQRVAVVAVDPSSPFTGGAILGDRIRMQRHTLDDGVFIRSLATRGHMGGLSRSTGDVVDVMDAMGFDTILVETVGVGQDEVEVVRVADTAVVVTVPGLGDDVQAIKSGLLEIADVLVVNKADRDGADRALHDLTAMLSLRAPGPQPEIVLTTATAGAGIDDLLAVIDRHRTSQQASGRWQARRRTRAAARVQAIMVDRVRGEAYARIARAGGLEALIDDVVARRKDPYSVAESMVAATAQS